LPLVFFVCILSIIGGLVVTGVHYIILYSGCPLGLNGCNDFTAGKEKYGFFLIRALGDSVPEDVVYIASAAIGAFFFAQMCTRLPGHLAFQIVGGGTVQGLVAVASGQRITLAAAGLRIVATCLYLGTGGTLGMDGPAIQVCTAVTTFCGWALGMRGVHTQSLLASLGFAAGFAASFNAPLAGVMFAMEELSHASPNLSGPIICIIVMVSIVATAVARLFSGNNELLQTQWGEELMNDVGGGSLNQVFGMHMWMLVAVPIAVVCSLFGHLTSLLMRKFRIWMDRLHDRVPFTILTVLAMVLSASIGSCVFRATGLRGIWGIGYESLQKLFDSRFTVVDYFIFAAGKMLAATLAIAARAPGDLLEPVLIVGAGLGGGIGRLLQSVVEEDLEQRVMQPCLVFGMVATFASCFRFPLTPVLIVLEVTGVDTYAIVLPAALAAFTAVTISNRLYLPLLESIMEEDGISLHELSEKARSAEDEEDGNNEEPEPESEEDASHAPSERSSSFASHHSSHPSSLLSVLRNMESSMLALSSPPRSRSSSRANSWSTAIMSERSERVKVGDVKLHSMLARLRPGDPSSSRNNSRNPSFQSIGNISLHIPPSECSRAKKGKRLNTKESGGSNDSSLTHNSENMPAGMTGVLPSVFGADAYSNELLRLVKLAGFPQGSRESPCASGGHDLQAPAVAQSVQQTALEISRPKFRDIARAELETMRLGELVRTALAMGVEQNALDNAIENSNEAVIDLILGKVSRPDGQADALSPTINKPSESEFPQEAGGA